MNLDGTTTVREVALNIPRATRVFEKLGIDYCCGGNKSLHQASSEANLSVQQVLESLESAAASTQHRENTTGESEDWNSASLADLIAHIKDKHHQYVREEVARLAPLLHKVCERHGSAHPELFDLQRDFRALTQELSMHMMKEEMVLFPYVERMEEAVTSCEPIVPAPFGTVRNPVASMVHEHDSAGNLLRSMRSLSNGYSAPAGACTSFKTLYFALAEFERDLHEHIHLENNILFPRAIQLEQSV